MRSLFRGYFTPTEDEFARLWESCVFAFDANVLLGFYRSTVETRQVLFSVLERISSRIFLPHQAASEYLKNRLSVITSRADQYDEVKNDAEKVAARVESVVREQAMRRADGISRATNDWASKMKELAAAGAAEEPDLLHSDDLLTKLADLFEGKTGQPYPPDRLKDIYGEGTLRYAQRIPPGYKDEKKGEPGKYGDLLVWFQLVDKAKAEKKPIIFVSGDAKEDWLLEHNGETLGPRPELRQEMLALASVDFYIYTTPRFLEFARQFLGIDVDTESAESELKKIEEQDRQAVAENVAAATNYYAAFPAPSDQPWEAWKMGAAQPVSYKWSFPLDEPISWTPPAESRAKSKYFELLPINGLSYSSTTGKWKCEIVSHPESVAEVQACYGLKFEPENRARGERHLKVWVSVPALEHDTGWEYKAAISRSIARWLNGNQVSGEISLLS